MVAINLMLSTYLPIIFGWFPLMTCTQESCYNSRSLSCIGGSAINITGHGKISRPFGMTMNPDENSTLLCQLCAYKDTSSFPHLSFICARHYKKIAF